MTIKTSPYATLMRDKAAKDFYEGELYKISSHYESLDQNLLESPTKSY